MSYYLLKLRPGSQTTIIFLDNGYSRHLGNDNEKNRQLQENL